MQQHPVPQNVTTFQFRLIGDMTIKQFSYLTGGVIIAYICYKLPLPIIFTIPLAALSIFMGFGLAFVPVEERPMDIWVAAFLRSIYNPTLYVWHREQTTPTLQNTQKQPLVQKNPPIKQAVSMQTSSSEFHPVAPKPTTPQPQTPSPIVHPPSKHNKSFIDSLLSIFLPAKVTQKTTINKPNQHVIPPPQTPHHTPTQPSDKQPTLTQYAFAGGTGNAIKSQSFFPQQPHAPNIPIPDIIGKPMQSVPEITKKPDPIPILQPQTDNRKLSELESQLAELQKQLTMRSVSDSRIVELQKQLTEVLSERTRMQEELVSLRTKVNKPPTQQADRPTIPAMRMTEQQTSTVKVITADTAVRAGLPRLTTIPNVITGIIKDHEGNFLPGVLVTVRDKDGVPLRALKTNKLGQFAASTPLANNTYIIEVEDPRNRYTFDKVQVQLNGNVVPAIEVVAKSEKELVREKMAKDLFGSKPNV